MATDPQPPSGGNVNLPGRVEHADGALRMNSDSLLLSASVQEFFYYEADLLDSGRYLEWLDLLSEDISYRAPIRSNLESEQGPGGESLPDEEISWFDESKATLCQRVEQLMRPDHWSEQPRSRCSHLVTNVRIVGVDNGTVETRCRFLLYRNRLADETDVIVGARSDWLRDEDAGWKVYQRLIHIDQSVLLAKNLTVLF